VDTKLTEQTIHSEDLQKCQDVLEYLAKLEIDRPMTNHTLLRKFLDVIKVVDGDRRNLWNKEKFGAYEEIADNVLKHDFCADDIPF